MRFLYNIFISLMIFGMKIGGIFNYKLKRGLAGRRQSCNIVKQKFSKNDKVIWMHAASLGEYEQGIPVLEKLKKEFPQHKILITFFSPSGYENVVKKNHIADAVCYLPFDLRFWIRDFMSNFTTDIFVLVKYDYWYNLLSELKNQKAKIYVISALFYETQIFSEPYGKWFLKQIRLSFDWFFHQTKESSALAKSLGLLNSSTTGDTRFDRVKQIKERNNFVDFIDDFKQDKKLIVFGSSWEAEERMAKIISQNPDAKIVIAPHELGRVDALHDIFPNAARYSYLDGLQIQEEGNVAIQVCENSKILIIDCIGLLSKIYSYADLAVVGGGFHTKGLHNILEAATFGIPVIFGNHYQKNPEADNLIKNEGGKSFESEVEAAHYILGLLKTPEFIDEMGKNAENFVHSQPNSSELIVKKILENQS